MHKWIERSAEKYANGKLQYIRTEQKENDMFAA